MNSSVGWFVVERWHSGPHVNTGDALDCHPLVRSRSAMTSLENGLLCLVWGGKMKEKKSIIWPVSKVECCSIFFLLQQLHDSTLLQAPSYAEHQIAQMPWHKAPDLILFILIRAMCHWGKQSSSQCSESPPGLLIKSTCLLIAGRKQQFAFSLSSILDSLHSRYFDFSAGNRWLAHSS